MFDLQAFDGFLHEAVHQYGHTAVGSYLHRVSSLLRENARKVSVLEVMLIENLRYRDGTWVSLEHAVWSLREVMQSESFNRVDTQK